MDNQDLVRIIIVESLPKVAKQIQKVLSLMEGIEIIAELSSGEEAIGFIRENKPDVALIDLNLSDISGFNLTEVIHRDYPQTQVILVSQDKFYDTVLKAMRLGAADFITHDVKLDELNLAIKRAADMAQAEKAKSQQVYSPEVKRVFESKEDGTTRLGNIITVYSPKGGTGTTTLSLNLALALMCSDCTVGVVDSSMQFGDVAILLNEVSKLSILDLVPRIYELDVNLIDDVMLLHKSTGIRLLSAPPQPELAESVNGSHIVKILEMTQHMYDFVVVNTDSYISDPCLAALDAADVILLVSSQEVSAIQGIHRFLDLWDKLGMDRERLMLIVNKYNKNYAITSDRISESLKMPVSMVISRDDDSMLQSVNLGIPLMEYNKKSPLVPEFTSLAEKIQNKLQQVERENRIRLFS
jgi:pilus assembly protein CpaE